MLPRGFTTVRLPDDDFRRVTKHEGIYGVGSSRSELLARTSYLLSGPFGLEKHREEFAALLEECVNPKSVVFIAWPVPGRNPSRESADLAFVLSVTPQKQMRHLRKWFVIAGQPALVYKNKWQFWLDLFDCGALVRARKITFPLVYKLAVIALHWGKFTPLRPEGEN